MPAAALTGQYLVTRAFRKLNVVAANGIPDGDDNQNGLDELNEIFLQWNQRKRKSFYEVQQAFTFGTSKTSYTLGIAANSPDFVMSDGQERPEKLEWAKIILTNQTPNVEVLLSVINVDLYWQIAIPTLASQWPYAIYYQRTFPNGTIYPYPTSPSLTSNQMLLRWWKQFTTLAMSEITNPLLLPGATVPALVLTLAENLYGQYPGRADIQLIQQQARIARSDMESPNQPPPIIDSTDGVNNKDDSSFDWRSRSWQ